MPSGDMQILADLFFGDDIDLCGDFVFAQKGVLSGLEVCNYAVDAPLRLPTAQELRPFGDCG